MPTDDIEIPLKRLNQDLALPAYQTNGAAGMDLYAAIAEPLVLSPGTFRLIPCGFSLAIPEGFEAQVRPRSGLANKHGITVLNAPGTIDADYRGEVCALLINHGPNAFTIARGERIAQLIVSRVSRVAWRDVETLPDTPRGSGGFGHTGS